MTDNDNIVDEDRDEVKSCQNVTTCEISLSILILLVMALLGYGYFRVDNVETPTPETTTECLDSACLEAAIQISQFLNDSIDPCDDFQRFVCGKFIENPYGNEDFSVVDQQVKQIENRYKQLIITPPEEDDLQVVQLQKQFYASCSDLEPIDRGVDEFFWKLIDEIGGWPMTMGRLWDENEFYWLKTLVKSKQIGLPSGWFINFGVHADIDGKNYLKISPPEECPEIGDIQESLKFMVDVAVNMSISQIASSRDFNKVLVFKEQLAKICERYAGNDIEIGTINDLETVFPKTNWLAIINDLTNGSFNKQTTIAYSIRGYIQELDLLLIRTSRPTQANYIIWFILEYYSQYLTQPIRERFRQFSNQQHGIGECDELKREDFCLQETRKHFRGVSELAFTREILSDTVIRENLATVVDLFKEELTYLVEHLDWRDSGMKSEKMSLIDGETVEIGGPDVIFDDDSINNYLTIGKLEFNNSDPVEMLMLKESAHWEAINEVINQDNFTIFVQILENTTIVPVGILQGAFYNPNRPNYLNFQAIGRWYLNNHLHSIIEHWDPVKCRVKSTIGKHPNDNDYFSWDLIFEAYRKSVEKQDAPILPNLDQYDQNQLFWIYSALLQCERDVDSSKVNDMAKYSKYFSESFECSRNNLMNLEKKCKLP